MSDRTDDGLYDAIDRKLAAVAGAAPATPSWFAAWQALGPHAATEERLAVLSLRACRGFAAGSGRLLPGRLGRGSPDGGPRRGGVTRARGTAAGNPAEVRPRRRGVSA